MAGDCASRYMGHYHTDRKSQREVSLRAVAKNWNIGSDGVHVAVCLMDMPTSRHCPEYKLSLWMDWANGCMLNIQSFFLSTHM